MRKLWLRRRAVGSMIAGIVILTVFLSALTAMVVISQQYDRYRNTSYGMSQEDISRGSENITAVWPGLNQTSSSPCCQYSMLLSNVGGVGTQIARVYINTTLGGSSGCDVANPSVDGPCILAPSGQTGASFTFSGNDALLNPGEFTHIVHLWLPFALPNPGTQGPASPASTIWIVTTRGRIFTFQFPFAANPLVIPGFTPNLVRGNTRIAYWGSDSSQSGNCQVANGVTPEKRPAPSGVPGGFLYFIYPWTTTQVIQDAAKSQNPSTHIFLYVLLNNTTGKTLIINTGTVILNTADSTANSKLYFAGGTYVGTIYPVTPGTPLTAPPTTATIDPLNSTAPPSHNGTFIVMFQLTTYDQGLFSGKGGTSGDIFLGTAAINNQARDGTYTSMSIFIDGIYDRDCT
ncbi:MAG: hypothetical protein ABSC50_01815 [Candidatus Bathyarchaeia archaeon]